MAGPPSGACARGQRAVRERDPGRLDLAVEVSAFFAVLLAGLLTGSELTSWGIVHPTLWKLDYRAQVRAEKLTYRRFASIDPFLMTATVAACFVASSSLEGRSATLALAAGICFALMLAITLIGNMPLNLRVFRWDEEAGDPDEWRRIRRRWDRLHTVRISLDTAGIYARHAGRRRRLSAPLITFPIEAA